MEPLNFLVTGETSRVVVTCLGRTTRTCLIVSLIPVHVRVVHDVAGVLVSRSSGVTEFCDVSSCCSDWEDVMPQSFFLSVKSVHFVVQVRKKR